MKERFIQILAEDPISTLPETRPRQCEYDQLPGSATTFIGVRRSGKTMLLKQRIEELKNSGVQDSQLIYINFFDERLSDLEASDLGLIFEANAELYPDFDPNNDCFIFLDEIQAVEGWEAFVSRLLQNSKNIIFLTGSSAKLLSREIATSMRGRALAYEIFPLSFSEYAQWSGFQNDPITAQERGKASAIFNNYLLEGGFPAAFQIKQTTRQRLLENYYRVAIYQDVIERHKASNTTSIEALCRLLISQTSSLYTINKLTSKLKAQGYRIEKDKISEAIFWFEDAYLLESLPIFSESEQKRRVNPRKIYCIDHALAASLSFGFSQKRGAKLENIVYMHLRRTNPNLSYYKTRKGHEVDFCIAHNESVTLVQVSESLTDQKVKDREIRALVEAAHETSSKRNVIVTISEDNKTEIDGVKIEIVPAWKFCLKS